MSQASRRRDVAAHGRERGPRLMARRPNAIAGGVITAAVLGLARAAFLVVRVDGESMAPGYRPGDAVLTARRWITGPARPGDVVVCRLPAACRDRADTWSSG